MDDYVRRNDLGTAIVLRAAAAGKVRRLVYASSMVVYGEGVRVPRAWTGEAAVPYAGRSVGRAFRSKLPDLR